MSIENAKNIAHENGNQEITCSHVFYSLLTQENGLIPELLQSFDKKSDAETLKTGVEKIISSLPKISNVN
ncbi:MAG: Clp protease N-terminal domain-containing protein, partial [Clostridia bacterium]|nr:Clp protease N-terminal domain-containing protein [Clostridia bacterium]